MSSRLWRDSRVSDEGRRFFPPGTRGHRGKKASSDRTRDDATGHTSPHADIFFRRPAPRLSCRRYSRRGSISRWPRASGDRRSTSHSNGCTRGRTPGSASRAAACGPRAGVTEGTLGGRKSPGVSNRQHATRTHTRRSRASDGASLRVAPRPFPVTETPRDAHQPARLPTAVPSRDPCDGEGL